MTTTQVLVKDLVKSKRVIMDQGVTFTQCTYNDIRVIVPSFLLQMDHKIPILIPDIPITKRNVHLATVWVSVVSEMNMSDNFQSYPLWNSFKRFLHDTIRCKGYDEMNLKCGKLTLSSHLGSERREIVINCSRQGISYKEKHSICKNMYSPNSRWIKFII